MKLVMFSPKGAHLERGWPGRIEGDRVIQLAAQTLQSFFTAAARRASTPSTRSRTWSCERRSCTRRRCATSTRSSST